MLQIVTRNNSMVGVYAYELSMVSKDGDRIRCADEFAELISELEKLRLFLEIA